MKNNVIDNKITPYFKNKKMSAIKVSDIIAWQNEMIAYRDEKGKPYSPTYLKTIHNQLSAIFNHAVRFYELRANPASKAGNMGNEERREMLFWTKEEYQKFAEEMMEKYKRYYALLEQRLGGRILQFNFTEQDDRVFGNYANKTAESFLYQLRKLNLMLMEEAQLQKNLFVIDLAYLQNQYGMEKIKDAKMYYLAKMPLSTHILPQVAAEVLSVLEAIRGRIKKCVVVDLDQTLWGGVIGDDGMEHIQIGELGQGQAFSDFQNWLKELRKRGILLAVCSKNEEDTAKEPFLKHPEMVLRLEDIALFVANWENKADNIRYIQKTLNIGMDSMVFLDDNPFERNLVRSLIPEITVPELPEDPSQYVSYLQSLNLFETASYSGADKDRTRMYREEMDRKDLQKQYGDYEEYLKDLEMKAQAKPFDPFHYARIAQLSQRSNQFNLRTIRYTEQEVEHLAKSKDHLTMYVTLQDKFGDYGLISVVVLDKMPSDTLFISEWLMSCRVLKRGVEEFIMDQIVELARKNGFQTVTAEYLPTAKNAMVSELYERMGMNKEGEGRYRVSVSEYQAHKTCICQEGELQ